MKLFLFLDDWMIEATRDVVRRWPQAQPADVPPFQEANSYHTVHYDMQRGKYRCWFNRYLAREEPKTSTEVWKEPDILKGMFYAESDDGFSFSPCAHGGPTDVRFPEKRHSLRFPLREGNPLKIEAFSSVFLDEFTDDPSQRYKASADAGFIYTSPDGIHWTPHLDRRWMDRCDSDTSNNLVFNPITGKYQVFCRPGNLDRRIAITESADLRTFSPRRVVVQPDGFDPPLHQFYGMKVFWYEDLFIGLLWDNFIPNLEPLMEGNLRGKIKMCGIIDTSLAYSYDGRHWLRGPRTPILPRAPMPEFGWAGHYATCLVAGPDGVLRIYSHALRLEHGEFDQQMEFFRRGEGDSAMRPYRLRKDGFAYLEPIGGHGWVRTRGLVPRDGNLSINFEAPLGWVLVQVCDPSGVAYPGFSFEDCVPLTGDETAAPPRWKTKKLDELAGRWVRLEFKFYQARLYAYRWNCLLHYALEAQERI